MIQAYRLLAARMMAARHDYPLHLGVTEAEKARTAGSRRAIGIGALLLDGLGDTIRVSLTEDPWAEIDPCRRLVSFFNERQGRGIEPFQEKHRDVSAIVRRTVQAPLHRDGSVILKADAKDLLSPTLIADLGTEGLDRPDALLFDKTPDSPLLEQIREMGIRIFDRSKLYVLKGGLFPENEPCPEFILFEPSISPIHETRRLIDDLKERQLAIPVILSLSYSCSAEDLVIRAGVEAGALLCDGLGDGICLSAPIPLDARRKLSFNLLQSARMRTTRTDYISCPGCGRTLFDLQEVARRIREKTSHFPASRSPSWAASSTAPAKWPMPTSATSAQSQAKSISTSAKTAWSGTLNMRKPTAG